MSIISKYGIYYPIQWLRREPVRRCLRELQNTQWYSPEQLATWQWEGFRETVLHAMTSVPYYQDSFEQAGVTKESFNAPEDIRHLPLLTKTDLREHTRDLISCNYRGPLASKTTGGSTGEAVTIIKDKTATGYARGTMWRNYGWWGIDIGDRQGEYH